MATNIVCSDTYIDAFCKLDKKTQKKSIETMRHMQRSLRSESLKVEKLNTKLDFKSVRVTQDFRAIFTQSGNTVLLVYIDRHDDAYLWASKRLKGFDAASARPAYEYFERSKVDIDENVIGDQEEQKKENKDKSTVTCNNIVHSQPLYEKPDNKALLVKSRYKHGLAKIIIFSLTFFIIGVLVGYVAAVAYFI